MDDMVKTLELILIAAIPILFAVTVHEVAHGWVASKFGDKTALRLGRLTLNPIKHIDLIGTILVPLIFLWLGGFIFGWAKPVPVDWRNLKNPRRDMAFVALAGPGANLLMAVIWGLVAKIALEMSEHGMTYANLFVLMGVAGISINLMLMILNLIPIPPLDGSRVVASLLEKKWAAKYEAIEPYGFFILIALILSGALTVILQGPYSYVQKLIHALFGL